MRITIWVQWDRTNIYWEYSPQETFMRTSNSCTCASEAKRPCGLCPPESFCPIGPEIFKSYSYAVPVAKFCEAKKNAWGTGSNSTCFCGFHLGVSKLRAMWTLIHNPLEQRVPFSEKLICWCFLFAADNILSCQKYPTCYTHCIRNHRIHTVPIASQKIWIYKYSY